MFHRVMAAALVIGATGGASLAVAQNTFTAPAAAIAASVSGSPKIAGLCQPVAFRIYFEPGSSHLNSEANDVIDVASQRVATCEAVQFQLAADPSQIAVPADRRRVSQRSVAILSAMRGEGITGEVYVVPLSRTVIATEANAGPDFIEVAVAPSRAPLLVSSNAFEADL
jgi:hypothetical protein